MNIDCNNNLIFSEACTPHSLTSCVSHTYLSRQLRCINICWSTFSDPVIYVQYYTSFSQESAICTYSQNNFLLLLSQNPLLYDTILLNTVIASRSHTSGTQKGGIIMRYKIYRCCNGSSNWLTQPGRHFTTCMFGNVPLILKKTHYVWLGACSRLPLTSILGESITREKSALGKNAIPGIMFLTGNINSVFTNDYMRHYNRSLYSCLLSWGSFRNIIYFLNCTALGKWANV